ncbi:MAG: glutaminyl-peptide cyclotransferase [Oligoflexia bacterium]|nr:glutaminyl-peptide cyclotransferase [Oligoflexia bacterium]
MKALFPLALALAAAPGVHAADCRVPAHRELVIESMIRRQAPAFTQGLAFVDGALLESAGAYLAPSTINRIDPRDGSVKQLLPTPESAYGEGLARFGKRLYQLTWLDGKVFVYDVKTLALRKTLALPLSEGWGIAALPDALVLSDGTSRLTFVDPETFAPRRSIEVHDTEGSISRLNELEYSRGRIYANIWHEKRILEILPESGCVASSIDLVPLLQALGPSDRGLIEKDPENVANGIAFDPDSRSFYITGKNWPVIFKARILPDPV